jgi:type I restriction enzyme, R subunit
MADPCGNSPSCKPNLPTFSPTDFLDGRRLTANQREFIDFVIDHLTARGVTDPRPLYEPPFTDFNHNGVEGVSEHADVLHLVKILREIEPRSAA